MDNKPRSHMFPTIPGSRTSTLPPIDEVVMNDCKRNERVFPFSPLTSSEMRENMKNYVENLSPADKKRLEILNNLRSIEDIEDVEYVDESETTQPQPTDLAPDSIGNDLIMLVNTDNLTDMHKKVYNIIIGAFKAKGISEASIYCILQSIPYIDIIDDVVVIYTKMMDIFEKIEVPCVNIALALRDGFKDKNLKVKFVPFKIRTISDYFSGVNWKIR